MSNREGSLEKYSSFSPTLTLGGHVLCIVANKDQDGLLSRSFDDDGFCVVTSLIKGV